MKEKIILFALIMMLASCTAVENNSQSNKLKVVTTVYPLYDFARNIAGETADVYLLLPPGSDPHTWEPKPSDIKKVSDADLFIYIGADLEPWMESVKEVLDEKTRVIDSSSLVTLIKADEHLAEEHDEEHLEEEHEHGEYDPHIWLDFNNDIKIVTKISDDLISLSPENKEAIEKNTGNYIAALNDLDQEYKTGLAACKHDTFITGGHSAFAYLAKRYGLEQVSVSGISPNAEPSPQTIVEIIETAKKENLKYIFFEALVNPKVADVISGEIGAQTLLLNPGHSDNTKDSFMSIMRSNLASLKTALECS